MTTCRLISGTVQTSVERLPLSATSAVTDVDRGHLRSGVPAVASRFLPPNGQRVVYRLGSGREVRCGWAEPQGGSSVRLRCRDDPEDVEKSGVCGCGAMGAEVAARSRHKDYAHPALSELLASPQLRSLNSTEETHLDNQPYCGR
jgi:hypothetical protein